MARPFKTSLSRIRSPEGDVFGAGFLVSERHVVTCAHVVAQVLPVGSDVTKAPDHEVNLDFPLTAPGQLVTARVVKWHPVVTADGGPPQTISDIAVLELTEDPPHGTQSERLLDVDDLWGHTFRAFGFPQGFDNGVWASGRLLTADAGGWVVVEDVKQTGYFIAPGFSGGPVWDEQANAVVGMIVAVDRRADVRAAFIIPTAILIEAWPNLAEHAGAPCPRSLEDHLRELERNLDSYAETVPKAQIVEDALNYFIWPRLRELRRDDVLTPHPTGGQRLSLSQYLSMLQENTGNIVLLIAGPGQGKTTLCYRLLSDFAKATQKTTLGMFPIYHRLERVLESRKPPLVEEFLQSIANFLNDLFGTSIDIDTFEPLVRKRGGFLFLFDGYDELLSKASLSYRDNINTTIRDIATIPNSCVFLTCRKGFFSDQREDLFTNDLKPSKILELLPFNRNDIKKFFQKIVVYTNERPPTNYSSVDPLTFLELIDLWQRVSVPPGSKNLWKKSRVWSTPLYLRTLHEIVSAKHNSLVDSSGKIIPSADNPFRGKIPRRGRGSTSQSITTSSLRNAVFEAYYLAKLESLREHYSAGELPLGMYNRFLLSSMIYLYKNSLGYRNLASAEEKMMDLQSECFGEIQRSWNLDIYPVEEFGQFLSATGCFVRFGESFDERVRPRHIDYVEYFLSRGLVEELRPRADFKIWGLPLYTDIYDLVFASKQAKFENELEKDEMDLQWEEICSSVASCDDPIVKGNFIAFAYRHQIGQMLPHMIKLVEEDSDPVVQYVAAMGLPAFDLKQRDKGKLIDLIRGSKNELVRTILWHAAKEFEVAIPADIRQPDIWKTSSALPRAEADSILWGPGPREEKEVKGILGTFQRAVERQDSKWSSHLGALYLLLTNKDPNIERLFDASKRRNYDEQNDHVRDAYDRIAERLRLKHHI